MKRSLWILALASIGLLLTGCGAKDVATGTMQDESGVNVSECRKGCDMIAKKSFKKQDCYNLCETSKKLESDDISDCEDIEKTSNNFVTKDTCIQDKAIQTKNPEFCEAIENGINKDACYMGLADDLKDKSICEKITNDIIKTTCKQEDTEE